MQLSLGVGPRDGSATHRIFARTVHGWSTDPAPPNLSAWEEHRPIVFINGCQTTALSPEQMLSFVSEFNFARASGVIGSEVSVQVPVAIEAASILLRKLVNGVPAGVAIREMRWELANKGNLLGLAYSLYALADLSLIAASAK